MHVQKECAGLAETYRFYLVGHSDLIMIGVYGLYALIRGTIKDWHTGLKRIPLWLLSLVPGIVYGCGYFLLKG